MPNTAGTATAVLEPRLEDHRVELTAYCYRMLGGTSEAEDAVQDTLVRAWRSLDRFEGRSTLRSWLYRIATNVCMDLLGGRERRARPMDLSEVRTSAGPLGSKLPEVTWIEPIADGYVLPAAGDPADLAVARDTIRLAFIGALQHLPPRQRAVLILRDVLSWRAAEVADLLDTTVASVNSALQRARATLADCDLEPADSFPPLDEEQQALLDRYVEAFERYDMDGLTALLHEEATMSMPPYALWMRGHEDIVGWLVGTGRKCRGSRLLPTRANGTAAFGQYRCSDDGGHEPWALQVLEVADGRIVGLNSFLDTARLFPHFGLPLRLDP